MAPPIRIAIADDYDIVVAGIAGVLAPFADRVDVVELDTSVEVVSDVDVILYDTFGQSQADADEVAALAEGHAARVLVFTWNTDAHLVDGAFSHGVAGVIGKSLTGEELVEAIERVHAGEELRPARGSAEREDGFGSWPGEDLGLSPRESEVLALICQGLSNQEITERAFLGLNTVKTYIRTLYRKIGATSRTQAVLWGVAHGFRPDHGRRVLD